MDDGLYYLYPRLERCLTVRQSNTAYPNKVLHLLIGHHNTPPPVHYIQFYLFSSCIKAPRSQASKCYLCAKDFASINFEKLSGVSAVHTR